MHALLRSYGRDALPELVLALDRIPAITGCIVAVKAEEPLPAELPGVRKPVRILPVENYGWSRALNAGLEALPSAREEPFVLIVSNEVTVSSEGIDRMAAAAAIPDSSCGYVGFAGREEPSYRVPRNTCVVWNRSVFELGLFDQRLDAGSGMEDYELVLRAYAARKWLPRSAEATVGLRLRANDDFQAKLEREHRAMQRIETMYPETDVAVLKRHLGIA